MSLGWDVVAIGGDDGDGDDEEAFSSCVVDMRMRWSLESKLV